MPDDATDTSDADARSRTPRTGRLHLGFGKVELVEHRSIQSRADLTGTEDAANDARTVGGQRHDPGTDGSRPLTRTGSLRYSSRTPPPPRCPRRPCTDGRRPAPAGCRTHCWRRRSCAAEPVSNTTTSRLVSVPIDHGRRPPRSSACPWPGPESQRWRSCHPRRSGARRRSPDRGRGRRRRVRRPRGRLR